MLGAIAVLIDVPPGTDPSLAGAAVESCDGALGSGQCRHAPERPEAEWHALVRFGAARERMARVELRQSGSGKIVEIRELRFAREDTAPERWASVGVLIAALVVSHQEPKAPQESDSPEPERPPPPEGEAPPRFDRRGPGWRFDATALATRGLEQRALQPGGGLRISLELPSLPLFVMGSGAYTHRIGPDPSVSWLSSALGFGVRATPAGARYGMELRTEMAIEQWFFGAEEPGRRDQRSATRFGPRVGLDGTAALSHGWQLLLGVQASVLRPEVLVDVAGETRERVPPWSAGLLGGVRFRP
jgi:hypothetical protein